MFLIYISGIDGCGKTTQANLLVDNLRNAGVDAEYMWLRWEPSLKKIINLVRKVKLKKSENGRNLLEHENFQEGTWLNFKRRFLSNPLLRYLWMLYACNDYYYSCRMKIFAKTSGVIIADRYIYDFVIDQAVNFLLPPEKCMNIITSTRLSSKLRMPDLNLIIDIPAGEAYKRKMDGTPLNYLELRRSYYQRNFDGKKAIHFDGLKGIPELANEILNFVMHEIDEG